MHAIVELNNTHVNWLLGHVFGPAPGSTAIIMKNVRKAMGLLALLVWLLATGCVGLAVDVIRAAPDDDPPAADPVPAVTEVSPQPVRRVTIRAVEGEVTLYADGDAPRAAEVGAELTPGDELYTGPESRAVLELDDGTVMVVSENASLTVIDLEGTSGRPISRFLMRIGEVFAARDGTLPDGSAFEILTPHSVAAIRGSAMRVTARPAVMRMACLEGHCYAGSLDEQVSVSGGESVTVDERDGISVAGLTENDLAAWREAAEALRRAGLSVETRGIPERLTPAPTATSTSIPPTATPDIAAPMPAPSEASDGGGTGAAAPVNSGSTPGGEHSSQTSGSRAEASAGQQQPPGQAAPPSGDGGSTTADPPVQPPVDPPADPPAAPLDPPGVGDEGASSQSSPPVDPPPAEPPPDQGGSDSNAPGNSGNTPGGQHSSQAPGQHKGKNKNN